MTVTTFGPALRICCSIDVRAPVPIATMTITAATPMIMPSAVSAVRIALRRSAFTATMKVMRKDMVTSGGLGRVLLRGGDAACAGSGGTRAVAERDDARAVLGDVGLVGDEHDRQALRSALSRWKMPITSMLVRVSRLPVGSSASSSGGSLTSARAMATRCCCPPESWFGWWSSRSPSPTAAQRLGGALAPLACALLPPAYSSGSSTFSSAVVRGSRLKPWNTKPISVLRTRDSAALRPYAATFVAVEQVVARRRTIEAAEHVHERGLAGARRARQRTRTRPAWMSSVTPRSACTCISPRS